MSDDPRGLLVFAQVVDARSFSRAAQKLGVTKSAVSKHIQQLEAQLGAQLLVRTTRKLALTEVGERVYAACADIRQGVENAQEAVTSHTGSIRGNLRITAPAVLGRRHVVPLLGAFLEQHSAVQAELLLTDAKVDLVADRMDVAVRASRSLDAGLVARKIADVPLVACAAPRYLAHHKAPRTPAELGELEWIHHLPGSGPPRLTLHKGRRQVTIPLRGRLSCSDGAAGIQAAVHGFGVVVAPEFELGEEVRAGLLVPLLTDWTIEGLVLSAVFPPRRHVSAKVRAFADFVAERWRNPPWRSS